MATKQELLTALQTKRPKQEGESNSDYITRLTDRVQPRIDEQRARFQEMLDTLPTTALESLKQEALQILADQAEVDYKEANSGSSL